MDALRDKHGEGSIALGYQENKEIGVECGGGDGEDLLKNLSGFSIIITLCRIRTIEMV